MPTDTISNETWMALVKNLKEDYNWEDEEVGMLADQMMEAGIIIQGAD